MNLVEIEKVVARIQTTIFRNSNNFSIGMLKSHFRGSGIQFKEHQIYNPGDDVRFIDWKLSAKTNSTFVKTFEEERNVEIVVVMDLSELMMTGYKGVSKINVVMELTALLYLLADQTGDTVSVVVIGNSVAHIPRASGRKGITMLISLLQKLNLLTNQGNVNYSYKFDESAVTEKKRMAILKSYVARGKEVVYFTDLYNLSSLSEVEKMLYHKNLHTFKVTGPLDYTDSLPFSFWTKGNRKTRKFVAKEVGEVKRKMKSLYF